MFAKLWSLIEADSRAVEVFTALFVILLGALCWFGHWFGNLLPALQSYAGSEIYVTVVTTCCGLIQILAVIYRSNLLRWYCCAVSSAVFMAFGMATLAAHHLAMPGGAIGLMGAASQIWCCYAIACDMRYG